MKRTPTGWLYSTTDVPTLLLFAWLFFALADVVDRWGLVVAQSLSILVGYLLIALYAVAYVVWVVRNRNRGDR